MEIEIISHSHIPANDPKRLGQMDTLVLYRIDKLRATSLLLQGEVDDVAKIQVAVTADAKKAGKIIGHKFNVT